MRKRNFVSSHPLYQAINDLAQVTSEHPALRNGTHQHRYASAAAGIYAFSRIDRQDQREYVVALNNSEQAQTADIPTYIDKRTFELVYGVGLAEVKSGRRPHADADGPGAVGGRLRVGGANPALQGGTGHHACGADTSRGVARTHAVAANVDGSSFYEVTFYAKVGDGDWQPIGTDDTAPYRVFHDVSPLDPGTPLEYRAVVLDNGRHTATSEPQSTAVPAPLVRIEALREGSGARGIVEVRGRRPGTGDPRGPVRAQRPAGHGLRSAATILRPLHRVRRPGARSTGGVTQRPVPPSSRPRTAPR